MNYAEDRLDRRARHDVDALRNDFRQHLRMIHNNNNNSGRCNTGTTGRSSRCSNDDRSSNNSHVELARILLSIGWNRHAVYHYAAAWMQDPTSCAAAADYAQMAELAGFAEVGLVALLVYRRITTQLEIISMTTITISGDHDSAGGSRSLLPLPVVEDGSAPKPIPLPQDWLQQSAGEMEGRHCGCGDAGCGASMCFIPMTEASVTQVLESLQKYCQGRVRLHSQCQQQQQQQRDSTHYNSMSIPTAHEILGMLAEKQPFDLSDSLEPAIPKLLQFWKNDSNATFRPLTSVAQLLLIKLLYLVLPALAMEAAVFIRFSDNNERDERRTQSGSNSRSCSSSSYLATHYKSHWAYFVFIQSLVLGERIKPGRRRMLKYYHVPLWDRLWGLDTNNDHGDSSHDRSSSSSNNAQDTTATTFIDLEEEPTSSCQRATDKFFSNLQRLLAELRTGGTEDDSSRPPLCQAWIPPMLSHSCASTEPVYVVGDSHVLSLAWQTIIIRPFIPDDTDTALLSPSSSSSSCCRRLVVPVLTTGLKAWHVRSGTRFFTHTCLRTMLQRLSFVRSTMTTTTSTFTTTNQKNVHTILVSAGEIDCREGMGGPLLEGYTQACHGHVQTTVHEYVTALAEMINVFSGGGNNNFGGISRQILVLPVAPHLQRSKGGRVVGQASRRETMRVWNNELRRTLLLLPDQEQRKSSSSSSGSIYLLDYTQDLQLDDGDDSFALNPVFNADSTHMNSAFAPILERALATCGCDLTKL